MPSDDGRDEFVEQITADAYGDEGYWSLLQAFEDEIHFPIPAAIAGKPVVVTGLDCNEQRGIVAIIERDDHSATVSLLDIEVPAPEQTVTQLLFAYNRRVCARCKPWAASRAGSGSVKTRSSPRGVPLSPAGTSGP